MDNTNKNPALQSRANGNDHVHDYTDTQSFRKALEAAGLDIREPILPDGKLHRFHVHGDKTGSRNGWYVLYGGGLPTGCFGSWKTGIKKTWCGKSESALTNAERVEFRQRMEAARKTRETEEKAHHAAARNKALAIWKPSLPAPHNHPYLENKAVNNHGLRLHKGLLVIPMRDSAGNLHSLQFIDAEGNKRFLSGGRKKGCFYLIGSPTESVCVAEGYATAASIHESTGIPVAVAFDAGNLEPVALALRAKFPEIEITLCADNDTKTPGNPGLTKAKKAAAACGALLAAPPCHGDFNDLYRGARQ